MNEHKENAKKHIDWVHEWQTREGDTDATQLATAIIAVAESNLAIAAELERMNSPIVEGS